MAIRVSARATLPFLCKSVYRNILPFTIPKFKYFSTNPRKVPIGVLEATHERNLVSMSSLFQRYGFSPIELQKFLKSNRFLLDSNPSNIEKSLKILLTIKPSQEFLASIVYNCPAILKFEFLKKWATGVSEMGLSGISSTGMENLLVVCRKFDLTPDDVSRRLVHLKNSGFSKRTVVNILEANPRVITLDEDDVRHKVKFLMDVGLEHREIDRIIGSVPSFLEFDVRTRTKPLFSEFEQLGFRSDMVKKEVIINPRVLELEVGELSHCLKLLRTLKCRIPIKERIFASGEFRAGYEAKLRVDCLRGYGFTHRDAFTVLWKEPRIILYGLEDIEKKIEFLINTMNFSVLCLLQVPEYLGVNFEKKIVPRYKVIDYLRSKGALGDHVGLRDMIKPSRMRFYNFFVKPYPECEEIYGRFARDDANVRKKHPVGMWKLFKPHHYPESSDDVKNIKSFMESLA